MIKKYLDAAIKRYKESFKKRVYIHPISQIDAEIIAELQIMFDKTRHGKSIECILNDYKCDPDKEILERLRDLNKETKTLAEQLADRLINSFTESENEEAAKSFFFETQGKFIKKRCIFGVEAITEVEKHQGKSFDVYKIILNPLHGQDLKSVPPYADVKLEFFSEEERDAEYERIKAILDAKSEENQEEY